MEKVLFGDNQFFGVNHLSEDKARVQAMRFRETSAIIGVLDIAYDAGIHAFMCTTHDRLAQVCDHVRDNRARYPDFVFYPCMPYAHKYASAVSEHGPLEVLRRFAPESRTLATLLKSGLSLAGGNVSDIGRMLVDAEMKMFRGLKTPVIFLQNVVTDLFLGLGFDEGFKIFADYVRSRYDAEPGYITMNLPRLLDALDRQGIDNPIVCANINKIGFRMSGGRAPYEKAIRERRFRPVAMSVLASGALNVREAVSYVAQLGRVEAVVFGASSGDNIRDTKAALDELFLPQRRTSLS